MSFDLCIKLVNPTSRSEFRSLADQDRDAEYDVLNSGLKSKAPRSVCFGDASGDPLYHHIENFRKSVHDVTGNEYRALADTSSSTFKTYRSVLCNAQAYRLNTGSGVLPRIEHYFDHVWCVHPSGNTGRMLVYVIDPDPGDSSNDIVVIPLFYAPIPETPLDAPPHPRYKEYRNKLTILYQRWYAHLTHHNVSKDMTDYYKLTS